jgi:hypothetical protein
MPDVYRSVAKWFAGIRIKDGQLELEGKTWFSLANVRAHKLVSDIIWANLLLGCDRVAYRYILSET